MEKVTLFLNVGKDRSVSGLKASTKGAERRHVAGNPCLVMTMEDLSGVAARELWVLSVKPRRPNFRLGDRCLPKIDGLETSIQSKQWSEEGVPGVMATVSYYVNE